MADKVGDEELLEELRKHLDADVDPEKFLAEFKKLYGSADEYTPRSKQELAALAKRLYLPEDRDDEHNT